MIVKKCFSVDVIKDMAGQPDVVIGENQNGQIAIRIGRVELTEDDLICRAKYAVLYTPQDLSEEQQMQARKNLGLYYKEFGTPTTIEWNGNTENRAKCRSTYRITTTCPTADELSHVSSLTYVDSEGNMEVVLLRKQDDVFVGGNDDVIFAPKSGRYDGSGISKGIYARKTGNVYVASITYANNDVIHKIEKMYIPLEINYDLKSQTLSFIYQD